MQRVNKRGESASNRRNELLIRAYLRRTGSDRDHAATPPQAQPQAYSAYKGKATMLETGGLTFNPGEQSQRHTLNATGVSTPRMDGGDYAAYAYCTWLHTSPRKFACAHVTVTIDALPSGRLTDLLCMARQSDFLHSMQAAELETLNC